MKYRPKVVNIKKLKTFLKKKQNNKNKK